MWIKKKTSSYCAWRDFYPPGLILQSLIMSTAVPAIIGFSLWREVRLLFLSLCLFHTFCKHFRPLSLSLPLSKYCPRVLAELSELQELYDSDTVELINWIRWVMSPDFIFKKHCWCCVCNVFLPFRSQAPLATVFAGSPQILGMVKLCSGLAVTSLPLYSDINLLRRTENVGAVMFKLNSVEQNIGNFLEFFLRPTRCTEWDLQRISIKFWRPKRPTTSSSKSPFVTSCSSTKAAAPKTCSTSPTDTWVPAHSSTYRD